MLALGSTSIQSPRRGLLEVKSNPRSLQTPSSGNVSRSPSSIHDPCASTTAHGKDKPRQTVMIHETSIFTSHAHGSKLASQAPKHCLQQRRKPLSIAAMGFVVVGCRPNRQMRLVGRGKQCMQHHAAPHSVRTKHIEYAYPRYLRMNR